MRFDSLHIPAFGPFTDLRLDFAAADSDLQVIYGANEAGKSSLLRAIRGMLYEIPMRSEDDFLHPYKDLRIGGKVSHAEQTLSFYRKKGNQGTLLDVDQNTIDEGKLLAFRGAVNAEFFDHMFGLSTDALREGAEKLLSGEGELGTLLFSASQGGSAIDEAIKKLEEQANAIFSGKNGKQDNSFVIARKAYQEHTEAVKEGSTSANAWRTLERAIQEAKVEFEEKDQQLSVQQERGIQLDRLKKAAPLAIALDQVELDLGAIQLPNLPADFPDRVRDAQSQWAAAKGVIESTQLTLEKKRTELSGIAPFAEILEDEDELASLNRGIERHQDDLESLADSETRQLQLKRELQHRLGQLELDSAEELAALPDVSKAEIAEVEESVKDLERSQLAFEQAEKESKKSKGELKILEQKLEGLSEVKLTELARDLEKRLGDYRAQSQLASDWGDQLEQKSDTLSRLERQLELGAVTPDTVLALEVPSLVRLRELAEEKNTLQGDRRERQQQLDQIGADLIAKQADLDAESANLSGVSLDDLRELRLARDSSWSELAKKLLAGAKGELTEVDQFSGQIKEADAAADGLRDHAETLGKMAGLQNHLSECRQQKRHQEEIIGRIDASLADWQARWKEVADFIEGRKFTPPELIDWRENWDTWTDLHGECSALEKKLAAYEETQQSLLEELREHFAENEAGFSVLSSRLSRQIEESQAASGARQAIKEQIVSAEAAILQTQTEWEECQAKLNDAKAEWKGVEGQHQLAPNIVPRAALEVLRGRSEAADSQRELQGLTAEQEALEGRITGFQSQIQSNRTKHLPDSPEFDPAHPGRTVAPLSRVLEEAKERKIRHSTLVTEISELETELETNQIEEKSASEAIAVLVKEAKLESSDEFSGAIAQWETRRDLLANKEGKVTALRTLAGTTDYQELVEESRGQDSAALEAEIQTLSMELKPLKAERDAALEAFNEEKRKREALEQAKDDAAHAHQLAANALAKMETETERFIKLQHAITFLKAQVEAYREKSQGPMIKKTSEFFRTLTRGSFQGVAAQQDDKDPNLVRLVAKRGGEEESLAKTLTTDALSEGTRDQLYLALRLAAIDLHLESHTPMPLILDDILITFDDERAESVLEVLKELSKKTQVLVFTHHRHTAEMAEKNGGNKKMIPGG